MFTKPEKLTRSALPTSFGEFKPVGHLVLAFETESASEDAYNALLEKGFSQDSVLRFSAQEMAEKIDQTRGDESLFAFMGYEIKQAEQFYALAKNGCAWLTVFAPSDEETTRAMEIVRHFPMTHAEKYNDLMIEDLTEARGTVKANKSR